MNAPQLPMFGNGSWIGAGMGIFWIVLMVIIVLFVRSVAGGGSASSRPLRQLYSRFGCAMTCVM